jgi:hypothetical protein
MPGWASAGGGTIRRRRRRGGESRSVALIDEEVEVGLTREGREHVVVALPGAVTHARVRKIAEEAEQRWEGASPDRVPRAGDRLRFSVYGNGFSAHGPDPSASPALRVAPRQRGKSTQQPDLADVGVVLRYSNEPRESGVSGYLRRRVWSNYELIHLT